MGSQEEKPITGSKGGDDVDDGDVFQGWMADGAGKPLRYTGFRVKEWEETDVDIAVECCGVCASDLHVLRSGWVNGFFFFFFTLPLLVLCLGESPDAVQSDGY